jgi:perosamine synthetase
MPDKATREFAIGKTIPQYIFERVKYFLRQQSTQADIINEIIFSIPSNERYGALVGQLSEYPVHFGSENDLIFRNLACATRYGYDYVVRVTCDDPLKDIESAILMVELAVCQNLALVTNEHKLSNWIIGTTVEIYRVDFLRWLYFNSWTSKQREHIDYSQIIQVREGVNMVYEYSSQIRIIKSRGELKEVSLSDENLSGFSVTVDYESQFINVAKLVKNCNTEHPTYDNVAANVSLNNSKPICSTTKDEHFARLVRPQTTRSSSHLITNLSQFLEGDLRGSLSYDAIHNTEMLLKEIFGVKHAILMCNGTFTLEFALRAAGVCRGDHVIVPNLTMAATAIAVVNAGAIPIFADVCSKTWTLDIEQIKAVETPKTKAIIVVSLFGAVPNLGEISRFCKDKGITLIEDNAESMLSVYKGQTYGLFGDIASFSFQSTKHLTSFEGGVAITNDDNLAMKIRQYTAVGYSTITAEKTSVNKEEIQSPSFARHNFIGDNARISPLSAVVIGSQIREIDHLVNIRLYAAQMYSYAIENYKSMCRQQEFIEDSKSSYWTFPILLDELVDWSEFRSTFLNYGGLPFYSAWKLNSYEPAFDPVLGREELTNRLGTSAYAEYKNYHGKICVPNALKLQKSLVLLRTNLWDYNIVETQALALKMTFDKMSTK